MTTGLLALALAAATPAHAAADEAPPPERPVTRTTRSERRQERRGERVDHLLVVGPSIVPLGITGRYQRLVTEHISVLAGAGYGGLGAEIEGTGVRASRTKALVGADYHPGDGGLRGFYVGPRIDWRSWTASASGLEDTLELDRLSVEGIAGWRFVGDGGLSLGLGAGLGYVSNVGTVPSQDLTFLTDDGVRLRTEVTLGFAF